MTSRYHVSDSDDFEESLVCTLDARDGNNEPSKTKSILSHRFREPAVRKPNRSQHRDQRKRIEVIVPVPSRPWEYIPFVESNTVHNVLDEIKRPNGETWYIIEYEDGREENMSLDDLINLPNGRNAIDFYRDNYDQGSADTMGENLFNRSGTETRSSSHTGKRTRRTKTRNPEFVDITTAQISSDDDAISEDRAPAKRRRLFQGRISLITNVDNNQGSKFHVGSSRDEEDSEPYSSPPIRRGMQPTRETRSSNTARRTTRSSIMALVAGPMLRDTGVYENDVDELAGDSRDESDDSSIVFIKRRVQKRTQPSKSNTSGSQSTSRNRHSHRAKTTDSSASSERPEPTRRSGRSRTVTNMRERDVEEDIYADEVPLTTTPKFISMREVFQPISKDTRFGTFHRQYCEVCDGVGSHSNKGTSLLVYCQGCSVSIHKICLGYRSSREHMVTKIGHDNFVMQCRQCIGNPRKREPTAPQLDVCTGCKEPGGACAAFSQKKTSKQEERLREANGGEDPITETPDHLINNEANLLFRCRTCQRAWHFAHLPALSRANNTHADLDELRDQRLQQYTSKWQCKSCRKASAKVQGLVSWRTVNQEAYLAGQTADEFSEDEKEYLVKWEDRSYFHCSWMPGAWVWGVTTVAMRKAFFRRDEGANLLPKWTAEESIPEEWLRMEIVFDVKYTERYSAQSEASDKVHINTVDCALVKFHGLGYDEAVWEKPPSPAEPGRWSDFVAAYNEYLAGKYFKQKPASVMKERIAKFCSANFETKIELKKQPSSLTGGEIMPYQMEGLNWLLYNFHQKKNVILADEMGLGKTIQIVSLLASLIKDNPECWPFLIVTPNSTCPNWRREIKKWCPTLRVVAYYGGKHARDMSMKYELFPSHCSDMRAHVVITSYEAPVDDHSRSFFKRIKWAGMIVDEGQRLKNDKNLLYAALTALRVPFQVLLTGTPLQNNKRELFNLLQFLDDSINARDLDEKYTVLTKENLPDLHDLIRPFFLRRTKLQVLKFLPPMAQVILPVTMSVVQKKLYKSILTKDPRLIRSIFGQANTALRATERGNLNNILMQLRKCLCHPFLYSSAIEEKNVPEAALHRNLVDASAKFLLLEIMLPKLRERGHRVLLFSQFLNQLDLIEDFLNGLNLPFGRLDGTISSLEKQKRIDAFNAPNSELFAFLLSTRAGGVGINLATADTVIIMDPDFNPHQDIQALSRAHRIGQKKKVLVFQLMTKNSAEEKIVQIGRKKMALDQALIESMGAEDEAGVDLESILKHGAEALFNDDDRDDINYDSASVDKLLDRTQVEDTASDDKRTAESQFSYARVWANEKGALTEDVANSGSDTAPLVPNFSVWEKILKQREADAALEAAQNMRTFGRGKRARQAVNYQKELDEEMIASPRKLKANRHRESGSDTDFAAAGVSDADDDSELQDAIDSGEFEPQQRRSAQDEHRFSSVREALATDTLNQRSLNVNQLHPSQIVFRNTSRADLPTSNPQQQPRSQPRHQSWSIQQQLLSVTNYQNLAYNKLRSEKKRHGSGFGVNRRARSSYENIAQFCSACHLVHVPGGCPLGSARRRENCGSCGIAHSGVIRKCPSLASAGQIRYMLDELRNSTEPKERIELERAALVRELRRKG